MELPTPDLPDLDRMALLVVDVQQGFDDADYWGPRNNPECEQNIAALLTEWRARSRPVVFVRHDAHGPTSPLRVGQPGNDFKAVVTGQPDLLVTKQVNSCFHGTPDLDGWLRGQDLDGSSWLVSPPTTAARPPPESAATWDTRCCSRSTPPTLSTGRAQTARWSAPPTSRE